MYPGKTIEPGLDPLTLSQRTIMKMSGAFCGYSASLTARERSWPSKLGTGDHVFKPSADNYLDFFLVIPG